jgi:hypothetical protein
MTKQMLVPGPCQGTKDNIPQFPGYEWIRKLPNKKIYFALFQGWNKQNLPQGYDNYIVSFHLEAVDIDWLKQQQVTGTIVVLFDGQAYDLKIPGVYFVPFYYWHYQLDTMIEWFGVQEKVKVKPKYKFSAVCNRITQSKLWITTKLLETTRDSSLVVLNSWLKEKNVHNWQSTGNDTLDNLTQIFRDSYLGKEIKIDDFDNDKQNEQRITGTPWQLLYQDCAIHFTNESFHYSGMVENDQEYIWPGPFVTEKTLKCLLGATAFIPVGQFETYKTLRDLGFTFEYKFDTTWDNDPGNLTRFSSIIELIDYLNQFDADTLIKFTESSSKHNQNYIVSNRFFDRCQEKNSQSIERINTLIA